MRKGGWTGERRRIPPPSSRFESGNLHNRCCASAVARACDPDPPLSKGRRQLLHMTHGPSPGWPLSPAALGSTAPATVQPQLASAVAAPSPACAPTQQTEGRRPVLSDSRQRRRVGQGGGRVLGRRTRLFDHRATRRQPTPSPLEVTTHERQRSIHTCESARGRTAAALSPLRAAGPVGASGRQPHGQAHPVPPPRSRSGTHGLLASCADRRVAESTPQLHRAVRPESGEAGGTVRVEGRRRLPMRKAADERGSVYSAQTKRGLALGGLRFAGKESKKKLFCVARRHPT